MEWTEISNELKNPTSYDDGEVVNFKFETLQGTYTEGCKNWKNFLPGACSSQYYSLWC